MSWGARTKNMPKVLLRKIRISDKKYFAKWWRDKDLLKVTSGILKRITDKEADKYFSLMLKDKNAQQYMIVVDRKTIGHISLEPRRSGWHETQIVIGEKNQQGRGYGTDAIRLLIRKAVKMGIKKVYLEVRPNNFKAIRAYEKCGFRRAGIKRYPKNKYLPQTLKMVLWHRQ